MNLFPKRVEKFLLKREYQKTFDQEHSDILNRYYKSDHFLDPSKVAVTTVVPVYKEYSNGNFVRMIEALSQVDDQNYPETFELIFVVNNAAEDEPDAVAENKTILAILGIYNKLLLQMSRLGSTQAGDELLSQLSVLGVYDDLQEYLFKCLVRGIRLHGIDASSAGHTIEADDNIIYAPGIAKNIGAHIANERSRSSNIKTIIDYKDADCILPPDYFRQMSQFCGRADAVIQSVETRMQGLPKLDAAVGTASGRLATVLDYSYQSFTTEGKSFLSYYPLKSDYSLDLVHPREYDETPMLAHSAPFVRNIGGYAVHGAKGEDHLTTKRTFTVTNNYLPYTGDSCVSILLSPGYYDSADIINEEYSQLSEATVAVLEIKKRYLHIVSNILDRYLYGTDIDSRTFEQILNFQLSRQIEERKLAIRTLRESIEVVLLNKTPSIKLKSEAQRNPYIFGFVTDVISEFQTHTVESTLSVIQAKLPEMFGELSQSPSYDELITLWKTSDDTKNFDCKDFAHIFSAAYLYEATKFHQKLDA